MALPVMSLRLALFCHGERLSVPITRAFFCVLEDRIEPVGRLSLDVRTACKGPRWLPSSSGRASGNDLEWCARAKRNDAKL
jgi:hypothetical protein